MSLYLRQLADYGDPSRGSTNFISISASKNSSAFIQYISEMRSCGSNADWKASFSSHSNSPESEKIQRFIHHYFVGRLTYPERRKTRDQMAQEIMESLRIPDFKADWKLFSLIHCADIIMRTHWEGGALLSSINEALFYFRHCLKENSSFFSVPLPEKLNEQTLFTTLCDSLEVMKKLTKFELPYSDKPTPDHIVEESAESCLKEIESLLEKNPVLYFPYSYRRGPKNAGHAICFRITAKDKNTVELQLFNLGNAADVHPNVDHTLYSSEKSFAFVPIPMSRKAFFGEWGKAMFSQLLRYAADVPIDTPYDGYDILDVLCQFFLKQSNVAEPTLGPLESEYAADLQVSGNCSSKAVENVTHDSFIQQGVSKVGRQKIDLNKLFENLINHYFDFEKNSHDTPARVLLDTAVKSFATSVNDLYHSGNIDNRELLGTVAVLRKISKALKESSLQIAPDALKETSIPAQLTYDAHFSMPSLNLEPVEEKEEFSSNELVETQKKSSATAPPSFWTSLLSFYKTEPKQEKVEFEIPSFGNVQSFPSKLKRWIKIASEMPPEKAFHYVCDCVRQLPIPLRDKRTEIDVWDTLSIYEVRALIEDLQSLCRAGLCHGNDSVKVASSNEDRLFLNQFLLIYTLYAIVDKLARRCKETKLKGYFSPFLPPSFSFIPYGFKSLNLQSDNHRYTLLKWYFCGKIHLEDRVPQHQCIFPMAPFLNVEQYYNDQRSGKSEISSFQGVNQISYLAQFLSDDGSRGTVKDYIYNWQSALPLPSQILYYFSYLSFLLSARITAVFPPKLEFKKVTYLQNAGLTFEGMVEDDCSSDLYPFDSGSILGRKMREDTHPIFDNRFVTVAFPARHPTYSDLHYRFPLRGGNSSREEKTNFPNIFTSEFQNLDTNGAACYSLPNKVDIGLSEKEVRTLLMIYVCDNLSSQSAIQELALPENYILLDHEGAQEVIDICFFRPTYLIEELSDYRAKGTIRAFRQFLFDALNFHMKSQARPQAIFFLLREGLSFETFTEGDPQRSQALSYYENILKMLLGKKNLKDYEINNLNLFRVFLNNIRGGCPSQEEFLELILTIFHQHLEKKNGESRISPPWMKIFFSDLSRDFCYKNFLFITANYNVICHRIMSSLLRDFPAIVPPPSSPWKGKFPEYSCEGFEINFLEGTLYYQKFKGILCHSYTQDYNSENLFTPKSLFWVQKDGSRTSVDERWYRSKNDIWFERSVLSDGTEKRREQLELSYRDLGKDFVSWSNKMKFRSSREADGSIIIHSQNAPYLKITKLNNKTLFTRLDDDEQPLPIVLANLSAVTPADRLYHYTTRFVESKNVLCFIDQKTGSSEIMELNFFRYNLLFRRDHRGLHCSQITGMYLLATQQDLDALKLDSASVNVWKGISEEISHFKQAFILFDPQKNKWLVLCPDYTLQHDKEVFSHSVQWTSANSDRIFYFEYDFFAKIFKATSDEKDGLGYLHLVYLFKMQGNYERALFYLKKVNPLKISVESSLKPFHKFIAIKDNSIPSIAFNIKLVIFLIRSRNAMTESFFQNRESVQPFRSFIVWGMDVYRSFNESKFDGLPEELRISKSEQRILLLAFRNDYRDNLRTHSEKWELTWAKEQPNFDAQFQLSFSAEKIVPIKPQPQKVHLSPPIFSFIQEPHRLGNIFVEHWVNKYFEKRGKLPIPKYPVRVYEDTTLANFPMLFEWARDPNRSDSFDMILPALLKEGTSISSLKKAHEPAAVLFWVRHYADQFGDKFSTRSFNLEKEEEFKKFIKAIIKTVLRLENLDPERYKKIKNEVLDRHYMHPLKEKLIVGSKSSNRREIYSEREGSLQAEDLLPLSTEELFKTLRETEDNIYKVFNGHYKFPGLGLNEVKDEALFLLKKLSSQILNVRRNEYYKKESLPEILMKKVILKGNYSFFYTHRNMLTKKEMQNICSWVCEWYFIRVVLKLKMEGKLNLYIKYDHQNYPEISYFYLNSGKFPRPKQLKVYQKRHRNLINGRNSHFQLPAGDGKTDVMIPLFCLLAKRCGLMAVTWVTPAIYAVDKNNLAYNLSVLEEHLGYLEIRLSMIHKISGFDLEFIYQELLQYKNEGKSLIITKETHASLFLISHFACMMSVLAKKKPEDDTPEMRLERGRKIRWTFNILNFFEQDCLLIADESQHNFNPKNRSIYGLGEFYSLPYHESCHLFDLMYFYRGDFPDTPEAEKVARIYREFQINPSLPIENLQKALARSYLNLFSKEIAKEEGEAFIDYWTNPNAAQPPSLIAWGRSSKPEEQELASKIALTGYFLSLPFLIEILSMRTDVDHGRSLYPERRYEAPAHNKIVSSAEYEDLYKTTVLTIKGFSDRGLNSGDFIFLIDKMEEKHAEEQKKSRRAPTNQEFKSWLVGTAFAGTCELGMIERKSIDFFQLFSKLRKKPAVIAYFLKNFSFKEMGAPQTQLICTTSDIRFAKTIAFTATPNSQLTYPRLFERGPFGDFTKDNKFEIDVKTTLCKTKNSEMIFLEKGTTFFEEMQTKFSELFSKFTVILDPRGFLESFKNHEIAERWMECNKTLDGVIFCKDGKTEDENEQVKLLLRNGKRYQLKGNNIRASLKELDLDWDTLTIGTYYDPPRTEAWHVDQKDNTQALLLLCDGLTDAHMIQTLMRLRGFTQEDKNHTVTQIYTIPLGRKIFNDKKPHSEIFIQWTETNAAEQEKKNIILNAFTEIRFAIGKQADKELREAHGTDQGLEMTSVIDVFKKYQGGFTDTIYYNAYLTHGDHEILDKTRKVLEEYAERTYARFNYSITYEQNKKIKDEVNEIISTIEKVIAEIHTKANRNITQSVEHQVELRTQTEREQENNTARNIKPQPLLGNYGDCGIDTPKFLTSLSEKNSAQQFSLFLSPFLYFRPNFLRTAKINDSEDEDSQYLKPVQFITVIVFKEDGQTKMRAEFESKQIVSTNRMKMRICPKGKGLKHQAFMVNLMGDVMELGNGDLAPSDEIIKDFLKSQWYRDLKIDAALLRGHLLDMDAIFKRIEELHEIIKPIRPAWHCFERLWEDVTSKLIDPQYAHSLDFEILKRRWYEKYPSTPPLPQKKKEPKKEVRVEDLQKQASSLLQKFNKNIKTNNEHIQKIKDHLKEVEELEKTAINSPMHSKVIDLKNRLLKTLEEALRLSHGTTESLEIKREDD